MTGFFNISLKELAGNQGHLRDLTDKELHEYLECNEIIDARVLACICSEVLRRQIKAARSSVG